MPRTSCFPNILWIGRRMTFLGNADVWKFVKKTYDQSQTVSKAEAELSTELTWGCAKFLVESEARPSQQAYVTVYMQLPFKGTGVLPPRLRADQARNDHPTWPYWDLEAYKRLSTPPCPVTGVLLGFVEGTQGPDDLVPGGWQLYKLVSKPPGDKLGSGCSVLRGDYFCPEGVFWDFDAATRDLIRLQFENG